jgi:Icc protein
LEWESYRLLTEKSVIVRPFEQLIFTDVHISSEKNAPQGVASLFAHMFQHHDWEPELVRNTGDTVMAVDGNVPGTKAAAQVSLWMEAVKVCKAPIFSCFGNHDVWDGFQPTAEIPAKKRF